MNVRPASHTATLLLLFMVGLLGEVDYQVIPPLLPLIARQFDSGAGYTGQAVTVYALASGVFSLIFGYYSDRRGRRPFIRFGLVALSASAVFAILSPTVTFFFMARLIAGAATGATATSATSYAADFFDYQKRGRAMGVLASAYFAAAIVGVPLATLLAGSGGWRLVFLLNAVAALSVSLLAGWLLVDQAVPGRTVHAATLHWDRIRELLFVLLRRNEIRAVLAVSALSSGSVVGFITYLGSHLNVELGVPLPQVGVLFLCSGASALIGAPLSGYLADRFGKKTLLAFSGVAMAVCLAVIPILAWELTLYMTLGIAGLAMSFRMAPLLALTTELVGRDQRGSLLALRTAVSQAGIAICTFAASYLYSSGGLQSVGVFTAGLTVLSTLLVILLTQEPKLVDSSAK